MPTHLYCVSFGGREGTEKRPKRDLKESAKRGLLYYIPFGGREDCSPPAPSVERDIHESDQSFLLGLF